MKSLKIIAYIILIVIIFVLTFIIYKNVTAHNNEDKEAKTVTEIELLEQSIVNLLNTMNNIEIRNYMISYEEISEQSNGESKEASSKSDSEQKDEESSGNSNGDENSNQFQDSRSTIFELEKNGVLTNSENVNWNEVKNEIENLYSSMPSIVLDLYKKDINQNDILDFNVEIDNLAVATQDEDKQKTLEELSKLYDYISLFFQHVTDDEVYQKKIETKSYIFKAYSKLDAQNWNEISKDISNAINTFSQLVTNAQLDSKKQYSINRIYVMINELQNAVSLKNTEVFLVKYKNIVEEINNL